MQPLARVVLITGASRGIGAEVARQLTAPDTHAIVHYRENAERANAVVDAIRSSGGSATALAADITDAVEVEAMMQYVTVHFGRLDALILNASGGLDSGADPGYAMRLNRDAQRRLALLAMPLMPAGSRIVFVTSHQAHFYPHKAVAKGYGRVAASKRAGETALYAMRSELDHAGIHLTVVSGDGTMGALPTVEGFATKIVNAAVTPSLSTIVYAGAADYLMTVA
ncbi:SDR family oxidoreductase [Mycolicibacterium aichiense]|uniref:Short chain dehydrogenase n=1 Tax=Mycolicibacterium aichiense TaxID=1799 RepID=A0AAD1MCT6_9MYCO|nr:SDR family oxidoreductase [Mycolicibacterium aichiense]MCV7018399.1 SDR family oxidoreductase [Mycolicibacterium aichiense]BBX08883.1 short chain dehydrogenase [Mycolicibacterium aichiense]STZ82677.1 short chain dehydrogenase [Mycolicibacterium aichiense]